MLSDGQQAGLGCAIVPDITCPGSTLAVDVSGGGQMADGTGSFKRSIYQQAPENAAGPPDNNKLRDLTLSSDVKVTWLMAMYLSTWGR